MMTEQQKKLLGALRQMERSDGLAMRNTSGVFTRWCVESTSTGLDSRHAAPLDTEEAFDLLSLPAVVLLLAGDEVVFVHRHHNHEFIGGFALDIGEIR